MGNQRADEIVELMERARADTLGLFETARESDLKESPGFGFRPIIWHLAHIGVFEAYWILQKLGGQRSPDERYESIFDPIRTPREESRDLPSRREMEQYLERVRVEAFRVLEQTSFDEQGSLSHNAYIFHLVLEHEYQHQETLAYLLHLLDTAKKTRPANRHPEAQDSDVMMQGDTATERGMAAFPEGSFEMGAVWNSFAYDNELPPLHVHVPAFRIDRLLVTNEEYARFVDEGGYLRREWWSDEGWLAREREGWAMPLYWSKGIEGWRARRMFDEGLLDSRHPVAGISWFEAEAYARFAGKRLPTEAEWERAASTEVATGTTARERKRRFSWGEREPTPELCNFNNHFWGTTPVGMFPEGASSAGCLDMTGNVWEWTADAFEPFPGFKPFPYPEYSEAWFDGDHRVLKGGSWATRPSVLRTSFRNFFRRHFRIAFAGLRCAMDA